MSQTRGSLSIPDALVNTLGEAEKLEKEYNWLGAADSYRKALEFPRGDGGLGEYHEKLGYALYRSALQAGTVEEFRERMQQAMSTYRTASDDYRTRNQTGMGFRCDAMVSLVGFWLSTQPAEKSRSLDESWSQAKESLKAFKASGEALEYRKTYNQFVSWATWGQNYALDYRSIARTCREEIEYGDEAIRLQSTTEDTHEISRTYAILSSLLSRLSFGYLENIEEQERYWKMSRDYWRKGLELSEEAALLETCSNRQVSLPTGSEEALAVYRKALTYALLTKDHFMIGFVLSGLGYHTYWSARAYEDLDKRRNAEKEAYQCYEDANRQSSTISLLIPLKNQLNNGSKAHYYWNLAQLEMDLKERRRLLEASTEALGELLKRAEVSAYPMDMAEYHAAASQTWLALAQTEENPREKNRLLEMALRHRENSNKLRGQLEPFAYHGLGTSNSWLADIMAQLADLTGEPEARKKLMKEAIQAKVVSLELSMKVAHIRSESSMTHLRTGENYLSYGDMLYHFYRLASIREHLEKAVEAFSEAAKIFRKSHLPSREAECHWKTGQTYDLINDHQRAAENFSTASNNYNSAARKIPQLKELYQDLGRYMQAWSDIETARYHHTRQEYDLAKLCYEKAAARHLSTKPWAYLTTNYSAWEQVENGEDLSRKEESREAITAFQKASELFLDAKTSLQSEMAKLQDAAEKEMVTRLVRASDLRRDYCGARIILEEAKILDKKGDHSASSRKYADATKAFERMHGQAESEQTKREFRLLIILSKAWHTMTRAEAEEAPQLFLEASRLFEDAKELSQNEKTRSLALGHSRFCKALETGTMFSDSGDTDLHAKAMQHLESAAKYYLKAGFENAAEYAEATERLFDAYVHMAHAKKEADQEKKARMYLMTEKLLETAAISYQKAEYSERKDQVLRLLERVRKERVLAISLAEIMHAPTVLTTAAFAVPTPTHEKAVGMERFNGADIQSNIIVGRRELGVGEDLDLEIELVNAGRSPAQLFKIEEIASADFEIIGKPENLRVEDHQLNFKGKQLAPLKTEEIKLVIRPKKRGVLKLRPRILYLDESGRYKSHETEPVEVTVKELGISGWVKGH